MPQPVPKCFSTSESLSLLVSREQSVRSPSITWLCRFRFRFSRDEHLHQGTSVSYKDEHLHQGTSVRYRDEQLHQGTRVRYRDGHLHEGTSVRYTDELLNQGTSVRYKDEQLHQGTSVRYAEELLYTRRRVSVLEKHLEHAISIKYGDENLYPVQQRTGTGIRYRDKLKPDLDKYNRDALCTGTSGYVYWLQGRGPTTGDE